MANPRPSSSLKKHDSSITPQRKHRKLLKDGSGTEVWPESIEKIFVQGLREYWDSPYAAYSQSRGRSRWRNQFLVDYLNKQGIERSKKQVASHIQVLRNMWKGEPEFHLVAGGDELYPESDSPASAPVKLEDHYDTNSLIPFEWDEPSSNSVSPNFSPADSQSEFPPTPEHRPNVNLYPHDYAKLPHFDLTYPVQGLNTSPSISPNGEYIQQLPPYHDPSPFGQYGSKYAPPLSIQVPAAPYSPASSSSISRSTTQSAMGRHMSATPTHYRFPARPSSTGNKVTSIHLQAEGMTPFSVKVDALALSGAAASVQPPFSLRLRLCVPASGDLRTPPGMQGFLAGVALESVWSGSARCVTKVYAGSAQVAAEQGALSVTNITVGTVNAALPESALNRCRWLDASHNVTITQEIIVDDETLLFVIYELDRRTGGPMPAAALLGYQKFRAAHASDASKQQQPQPQQQPPSNGYHSNNSSINSVGSMHSPSPVSPFSNGSSSSNGSGVGVGNGTSHAHGTGAHAHAPQYARPSAQYALSPQALAAAASASMRRSF